MIIQSALSVGYKLVNDYTVCFKCGLQATVVNASYRLNALYSECFIPSALSVYYYYYCIVSCFFIDIFQKVMYNIIFQSQN